MGESLSHFIRKPVRTAVSKRKTKTEFIRRGITAIKSTQRDSSGIPAERVIAKLEATLKAARELKTQPGGS